MITRRVSRRPTEWRVIKEHCRHRWFLPLRRIEWLGEWAAYGLSRWSFLEVLEYLGSLSVLIGVIFYFSESGDRIKQRHYQAWQVINTAQGKGGSGGRIEALQELNADKVPLVGVDASAAFLQGIHLERANLLRADLSAADLRGCQLLSANFSYANLHAANFRGSNLTNTILSNANLGDSDLSEAISRARNSTAPTSPPLTCATLISNQSTGSTSHLSNPPTSLELKTLPQAFTIGLSKTAPSKTPMQPTETTRMHDGLQRN